MTPLTFIFLRCAVTGFGWSVVLAVIAVKLCAHL